MCRKNVYYNTYGDGAVDVTERVDTCRPGKMCHHPEVREYRRSFRFNKLSNHSSSSSTALETPSSLVDRKPTPYHTDSLAVPGKSASGVYINGAKISEINPSKKHSSHHHRHRRSDRDHVVVVPHAPQPPAPRRVLHRASTMPHSDYVVLDSRPSSSSSSSSAARRHSHTVPLGPVHLLEDLGRRTTRHVPRTPRDERHHHHHRHDRSRRASAVYYSSDGSDTPAAAAVRKELRWQDQVVDLERAAQNERIARRPKPVRLHQLPAEAAVRGILKRDPYDDLRLAVSRMDIQTAHGAESRGRAREKVIEGDGAYWDRLRGRFEEPRERKRRSRVHYAGADVYKYL